MEEILDQGRGKFGLQQHLDFPKESWLEAAARFVQFYRASTVDPAFPYASEEVYIWFQLPMDQLDFL